VRGHIRLCGKTWYAVLSIKDEFGRRKTVWRSLPDATGKRSAQDMCNALRQEMKSGKYITKKGTTLAEWVEHWLRAYAKRTETADAKIVQSVAGMGLL
jgi:hypothetical protein